MLLKHPDQYSEEELEAWVRHLVDDQVEEGPRLDYKEAIPLDRPTERREAAKDISSFANEIGGTVIYGIPEQRDPSDRPVPITPYGIERIPGLERRLEDIYVEAIQPRLVDSRILCVQLTEFPEKVIYLAWTPESWLGPHMVAGYSQRRYYRRGQYRAVPMEEHEVRDRYERVSRSRDRAEAVVDELETGILAAKFDTPCGSHHLIYPVGLVYDRVDFRTPEMQQWLRENHSPYSAEWKPALQGVQSELERNPQDNTHAPWRPYARLTRSGVYSVWRHTRARVTTPHDQVERIEGAEVGVLNSHLEFAGQFYAAIQYFGPVRVRLRVNSNSTPTLRMQGAYGGLYEYHDAPPLVVEIDANSFDLIADPRQIGERFLTEFVAAFGLKP